MRGTELRASGDVSEDRALGLFIDTTHSGLERELAEYSVAVSPPPTSRYENLKRDRVLKFERTLILPTVFNG